MGTCWWPPGEEREGLEPRAALQCGSLLGVSYFLFSDMKLHVHSKCCWRSPGPSCRPGRGRWGVQADPGLAPQTYDIQGSLQKDSQVTVSVVLENQSSSFLKSMELNVLDSLNTKLARPEGSSVHDGVPVPFQLPPGARATGRTPGVCAAAAAPPLGPGPPSPLTWPPSGAGPGLLTRADSTQDRPWPGSCPCHLPGCRTAARPRSSPRRHLQRGPVCVHHPEHCHGPEAQGDPVLHRQGSGARGGVGSPRDGAPRPAHLCARSHRTTRGRPTRSWTSSCTSAAPRTWSRHPATGARRAGARGRRRPRLTPSPSACVCVPISC